MGDQNTSDTEPIDSEPPTKAETPDWLEQAKMPEPPPERNSIEHRQPDLENWMADAKMPNPPEPRQQQQQQQQQ